MRASKRRQTAFSDRRRRNTQSRKNSKHPRKSCQKVIAENVEAASCTTIPPSGVHHHKFPPTTSTLTNSPFSVSCTFFFPQLTKNATQIRISKSIHAFFLTISAPFFILNKSIDVGLKREPERTVPVPAPFSNRHHLFLTLSMNKRLLSYSAVYLFDQM